MRLLFRSSSVFGPVNASVVLIRAEDGLSQGSGDAGVQPASFVLEFRRSSSIVDIRYQLSLDEHDRVATSLTACSVTTLDNEVSLAVRLPKKLLHERLMSIRSLTFGRVDTFIRRR